MTGAGAGALLSTVAMFCYAALDTSNKWLIIGLTLTQLLWVRAAVFLMFVLMLLRRCGLRRTARSKRPWLQAARVVLGVVESGTFVLSIHYLPLAETHAVLAVAPLIVVALSALLLGERIDIGRGLAVLAGCAGVLVILHPGFRTITWQLLIPLASAFLWAGYQLLIRLCATSDSTDTTLLWSAVVGMAVTTLIGPWGWIPPNATEWLVIGVGAAFGTIGQYALIKALERSDAASIQPYSYTLLVFVAVLGFAVFGNVPDWWTVGGAVVIVASGIYAFRRGLAKAAG